MKSKNIIKEMNFEELFLDYQAKFTENEELIFENGFLYIKTNNKKTKIGDKDIISIKKDRLNNLREKSTLSEEDRKNAVFHINEDGSFDDEKYRLAIIRNEDLENISYDEMLEILSKYNNGSFSYLAYSLV